MHKKFLALSTLFLISQTISPSESLNPHAIPALLDTCEQSREQDGTPDFYTYTSLGYSFKISPDPQDPWWKKTLIKLGIMYNYRNSTQCTTCCFKDKALEQKQETDPEVNKNWQEKPKNMRQAYNWSRSNCVCLYHARSNQELSGFHVYPTTSKNHAFTTALHELDAKKPTWEQREKSVWQLEREQQKSTEFAVEEFGETTATARQLHEDAYATLERKMKDTPFEKAKPIEVEGYGTFDCTKEIDAWGRTYFTCHQR